MKLTLIVFLITLVCLGGCASQPTQEYKDFAAYIDSERPRAERGEVKWTDYYLGLYSRALVAKAPTYYLMAASDWIKTAQKLERGEITMEDFQNYRRDQGIQLTAAANAHQAQQRAYQDAQQANALANMATTLQIMNAMQPQPISLAPAGSYHLRMQNVQGNFRYCTYANNVVVTVRLPGACPNSVQ